VVLLAAITLVFDGYDLVVYGTIVPTLLRDPGQLGALSPAQAGALGSYALIGVMVGALAAGFVGDYIGRRKVMLANIALFSIGMGATAVATGIGMFGLFRFITGIGVGALVATAGALVAEFAPEGKRNLLNAVVYSGVPAGGVLAALLAIAASDAIGWRGLFWVGALPIVLLPLALAKLPESPSWLLARGHLDRAQEASRRTGIPLPPRTRDDAARGEKIGFAALATRRYAWPTVLLGLMSFAGLLLTYGLNTWLPEIMGQNGCGKSYSLLFLLVLNLGAILGGVAASRMADRLGAGRVVPVTFGLAAIALALLALRRAPPPEFSARTPFRWSGLGRSPAGTPSTPTPCRPTARTQPRRPSRRRRRTRPACRRK
jgi:AAHS family benzoate transporter-like MFS transporter